MGTVNKVLSILQLFSREEPQWTVETAASRLGVPTSTAYRYFRNLSEAGLIVNFAAGRYVIGPAIFELDRLARRTDPLIVAARKTMDELSARFPENTVVLLARLYRNRVMCVDQRPRRHEGMTVSYERGRPMPLYRGSVSKIILANLPARKLARRFPVDRKEIAAAGLGRDMETFRQNLRNIRRAGFFVTSGEVDKGVIGISAPIASPEGEVFASISLVVRQQFTPSETVPLLAQATMDAAASIAAALKAQVENGRRQKIESTPPPARVRAHRMSRPKSSPARKKRRA